MSAVRLPVIACAPYSATLSAEACARRHLSSLREGPEKRHDLGAPPHLRGSACRTCDVGKSSVRLVGPKALARRHQERRACELCSMLTACRPDAIHVVCEKCRRAM